MAKALKEKALTLLQLDLLDCLADGYEDLEQIVKLMDYKRAHGNKQADYTKAELYENLEFLIREGYVRFYEPKGTSLVEGKALDNQKLDWYYFELTEKGKRTRRERP